jgi:hypothetical protein
MALYLKKPTLIVLVFIGTVAGLIIPSRYAFAPSVIIGGVFLLFNPNRDMSKKIVDSLMYSVISLTLSVYLLLVNHRIAFDKRIVAGRELAFRGNADIDLYQGGLFSLSYVLFPTQLGIPITAIAAFSIIGLILLIYIGSARYSGNNAVKNSSYFGLVVLMAAISYASMLLLSVQIEANLPLYWRYMIPFVLFFALLAGISFNWKVLLSRLGPQKAIIVTVALIFLYFPSNLLRTSYFVVKASKQGLGYNSLFWTRSPTLKSVKTYPFEKNAIILTNATDLLEYHSKLNVQMVPKKINRRTGEDYGDGYKERVGSMRRTVARNDGYYIHFNNVTWRFYLPSEEELIKTYQLSPVLKLRDGAIYKSGLSMESELLSEQP